jgi:hypothetical protein
LRGDLGFLSIIKTTPCVINLIWTSSAGENAVLAKKIIPYPELLSRRVVGTNRALPYYLEDIW